MKKGLTMSLILGSTLVFTSAYILATNLPVFNKDVSVLNVGDQSVLIDQVSQQELQNISKELDQSGAEELIENPGEIRKLIEPDSISKFDLSSNQLINIPHKKMKVLYEYGELNLIKFNLEEKQIVVPQKGSDNPVLHPSENYKVYTFEKNDDIFIFNPWDNSVKKVTKDKVGAFSKNEVMNREHPSLQVWASQPIISDENNTIAYLSKRANEDRFDIWVVDLNNNQEELAVENATPITWSGRSLIYTINDEYNSVGSMNIDTNQESILVPKTLFSYVKGDYLIYRTDVDLVNHYYLYNLINNKITEVKTKEGSSLGTNFQISPDKNYAVTIYLENMNNQDRSFLLVNLENGDQKIINVPSTVPPDSDDFQIEGWVNPKQFAVTYQYDQRLKSQTIVIDAVGGDK
jgi:hypothetical protein